ncbi:hypothetical protein [Corynebacterium auriscanis]|uniref:hypothetical protein n=1 Tax=Corynebacterium auriscanis TaxID=99807 RepID=UPI003CEC9225
MKEYTLSTGESYRFSGGISRLRFDLDTKHRQGFTSSITGFETVKTRRNKLLCQGFQGHSEVTIAPDDEAGTFDYEFKVFATVVLTTNAGEEYQLRFPSYGLGNRRNFAIAKIDSVGDEIVITAANATESKLSEGHSQGVDLVARNVFDRDDVSAAADDRPVNIAVIIDESVSAQLAFNQEHRQAIAYLVTGVLGNKNWSIAFTTSSDRSNVHSSVNGDELLDLISGKGTGPDAYMERKEVGWTRDAIAEFRHIPGVRFLVVSDNVPAWTEDFRGDAHVICTERPEFPTKARFTVLTAPLVNALLSNSHQGYTNAVKEIGHSLRLGVK